MNNMQKSFKTKSKLRCMADGGAIDPAKQLGVLGGDKTVGPGAGLKGTETIFKNNVGGVPTFTDQAARQPGAAAYTQNAAQPMGNFATNQAGRTATPAMPVTGAQPIAPSPMRETASTMMGLAKQLPVVGPMISVGQDVAAKMSSGLPSVSPAAATAQAAVSAAGRNGIGDIIRRQNLPVTGPAAAPAVPTGAAPAQSPYEKLTGQPAGSTSATPSSRPSWATGPRDGSKPLTFGPVGTPQVPPVASMPAPATLRRPAVPMDYMQQSGGFGPTKRPDSDVAQMASGGKVSGPGGPTEDKIPALLSDGEYVLPADTVEAVGVENLDALRAQTHEFVGGRKTRRGLRKFAGGGPAWLGDDGLNDELVDRTAPARGKGMVPYNGQAMVPYTAPPVAPAAPSFMQRASTAAGGKMGALGGIATGALEAKSAYNDMRDLDGGLDKTARVAEGVGRTAGAIAGGGLGATAGSALGPLGTVAGGAIGGAAGYLAPDATNWAVNKLTGQNNQLASTTAAENRDGRIAAHVQGQRDAATRASMPPEAAKLSLGQRAAQAEQQQMPGLSAIQQSAMDSANSLLSRRDRGGFNAQVPSNARDINRHFDTLIKNISGKYSSKGQGNLAKHLVEIEKARAGALGMDTRSQVDMASQNISGNSALRGQRAGQQAQALGTLSAIGNTQAMGASNSLLAQSRTDAAQIEAAQKAQAKAIDNRLEGEKLADTRSEDGLEDIRKAVGLRFGDDKEAGQRAVERIMSAGPEQLGVDITTLRGQERASAIEDLLNMAELADQADKNTSSFWGAQTDAGMPRAVEVRDPRFFEDWSTRGVFPALGAEVADFNPLNFGGQRVVLDDNARARKLPSGQHLRRQIDRDVADAPRRQALRDKSRNQ